jgi:hypothetical protein
MTVQRIVHFRDLLLTDRAVKRRNVWVRIHLAGRQSAPYWLEFFKTSDAKKAAGSLIVHLREKVARNQIMSDSDYNRTIVSWIEQLGRMGYTKKKEDLTAPPTSEPEAKA